MPSKKSAAPLVINYRDPLELQADPRNSRVHPADQIKRLTASVEKYGVTKPILLKTDNKTIGAGNGIWEAVKAAGLSSVPTITLELTEEQWRAYAIADNKLPMGAEWNVDVLRAELTALHGFGFDLGEMGFGDLELGAIGVDGFLPHEQTGRAEAIPALPKVAILKRGELWTLGDHRLLIGDSTDVDDVERLMGDDPAAMPSLTLSDPPYGIGYSYRSHDDRDSAKNAALVADAFSLGPKGKVWTPGSMNLRRDLDRFGVAKMLIWSKKFAQAGNGLGGASTFEPILVVDPPAKKLANDVLEFMTDRETLDGVDLRKHHPCPKPVALFQALAVAFSPARSAVYDPFCGSGTTLIAAQIAKRRCFAMEIDPVYAQVIIERWQNFSDATARRGDGKTLEQLKKKGKK